MGILSFIITGIIGALIGGGLSDMIVGPSLGFIGVAVISMFGAVALLYIVIFIGQSYGKTSYVP